ncbi:hypothetical protein [Herbidospora mongoliensis]|uniref:CdiA C-terminal domain-containing protein n=1 Tax=Herbidospora mongoliensis TaxID=688067 RepID=UPI00082AEBB8|nr:hypothetical protein [Herbidospora mongoliensis]
MNLVRRCSFSVVALLALFLSILVSTPAQADPANLLFSWKFGGYPDGPNCSISSYVASTVTSGRVRVSGAFQGCDESGVYGNGDGDLTVTGWGPLEGPNARPFNRRVGGSVGTGWCPGPCSNVADVPWAGPGTYCGMTTYGDTGYLIRNGSDPSLRPCRYVSGEPPVFPPNEIPPAPTDPVQPPPVPQPDPSVPIPCPQISSISAVPDGTVLQTCDTGRVYKVVGGAPLWMTSCPSGFCPGTPVKVTQAIVDAGRAYPRDAATARDEAGNIFKFVGGAPVHLSSCTVGCGSPISVPAGTLQLVHPANHMRQRPVDAATARDEAGHVFKFVGGAPIHLSSCSVGCGNPVPINGWSVANLDHMDPRPADGSTASDEAGNIFKFVGGAPIHLSNCSVGCGNPVPITAWSIVYYEHMNPRPADGSTAKDESGNIFKFVGGAPIHLSSCSVGCGNPVPINGWSVATLEHMNPQPADGSTAKDESGNIFKFVGGAPILLSNCSVGCGNPVPVNGVSLAQLDHMNPQPVDGSTAKDESGNVFKFVGGAPILLSNCNVECGNPVAINGVSVATLDHMRPFPADNATVVDERSRTFKFAGGAPLLITNCGAGCGSPVLVNAASIDKRDHMRSVPADGTRLTTWDSPARQFTVNGGVPDPGGSGAGVTVNQYSVDHILLDGTRIKDEATTSQGAVVGGAKIPFISMDELIAAGYGDKPMLVIPTRLWNALSTRIEDGTRLKKSDTASQAGVVGGAKIPFTSVEELTAAGYGDKPMLVIPARVWDALPSKIADGTRIKNSGSATQAGVVGGAKIPFTSMAELENTGYGAKPMQIVPARVFDALPTRIADGTLIRKPDAPQIGLVIGTGRITFPTLRDLQLNGHGDKPILTVPARVFDAMPPVGYIDETESRFDSPPNRDPEQERRVAEFLQAEGKYVKAIPSTNQNRQPDSLIDGTFPLEFKLVTTDNPNTVQGQIRSAKGQAVNALIDSRGYPLTEANAREGVRRYLQFTTDQTMKYLRMVGDGFDIVWTWS